MQAAQVVEVDGEGSAGFDAASEMGAAGPHRHLLELQRLLVEPQVVVDRPQGSQQVGLDFGFLVEPFGELFASLVQGVAQSDLSPQGVVGIGGLEEVLEKPGDSFRAFLSTDRLLLRPLARRRCSTA